MPRVDEQKFPQARAMCLYMMVHPGKKLNFMGSEIGQLREWDEKREQDWDMRRYPAHDAFYHYMAALNHLYLYLSHPALYAWDYVKDGFEWIDCHQESRSVYAVERRSEKERLVALFNFSQDVQANYAVDLPGSAGIVPLLYSDWELYGGATPASAIVCNLQEGTLTSTLQPLSAILLRIEDSAKTP